MSAGGDALYAALDAIRGGGGTPGAWRDVQRFVRSVERDEDRAQEALIRVHRAATRFEGRTVGEAVRWVRTIVVHRHVDSLRRSAHDPLAHRARGRPREEDDSPIVERLAAPDGPPDETRLQLVGQRVLDEVTRTADRGPARLRALAIVTAQAAWLRVVHQLSADDLVACLEVRPASTDALYKWVERGRTVILETVAALAPDDELDRDTLDAVTALFAARRKDAGRPRAARRKRQGAER